MRPSIPSVAFLGLALLLGCEPKPSAPPATPTEDVAQAVPVQTTPPADRAVGGDEDASPASTTGDAVTGDTASAPPEAEPLAEVPPQREAPEPTPEPAKPKPRPKAPAKPSAEKEPAPKEVPVSASAVAQGREIFMSKCKSCHGDDGRAATKMGEKHEIDSWKTPGWKGRWPLAKIRRVVTEGIPDTKMRAYEGKLSPEEIEAVSAFARTLGS